MNLKLVQGLVKKYRGVGRSRRGTVGHQILDLAMGVGHVLFSCDWGVGEEFLSLGYFNSVLQNLFKLCGLTTPCQFLYVQHKLILKKWVVKLYFIFLLI